MISDLDRYGIHWDAFALKSLDALEQVSSVCKIVKGLPEEVSTRTHIGWHKKYSASPRSSKLRSSSKQV